MKTQILSITLVVLFFLSAFTSSAADNNSSIGLKTLENKKVKKDFGGIYIKAGSSLIVNIISINYESPDLIKANENFDLRLIAGVGSFFTAAFFDNKKGSTQTVAVSFIYGKSAHHFEFDLGYTNYQTSTLINLRSFIGYRFEVPKGRMFLKAGLGTVDLFQLAFGMKL